MSDGIHGGRWGNFIKPPHVAKVEELVPGPTWDASLVGPLALDHRTLNVGACRSAKKCTQAVEAKDAKAQSLVGVLVPQSPWLHRGRKLLWKRLARRFRLPIASSPTIFRQLRSPVSISWRTHDITHSIQASPGNLVLQSTRSTGQTARLRLECRKPLGGHVEVIRHIRKQKCYQGCMKNSAFPRKARQ